MFSHRCGLAVAALVLGGALAAAAAPPAYRWDLHGDPLPPGAVARLGTVRWRQFHGFDDPVLSPDGRWLVSASTSYGSSWTDGLGVWNCSTGRLHCTLDKGMFESGWPFSRYAFLPDGMRLLSTDGAGTFFLWTFPSFRLERRWQGPRLRSLVVSPDGRYAAGVVGGVLNPSDVRLLDLHTGKSRLLCDDLPIKSLAFTPDGCLTLVEKPPEKGRYFGDSAHLILRIDPHTRRVHSRVTIRALYVLLAPDGRHVAATRRREGVRLYRTNTGAQKRLPMAGDELGFYHLAFRTDGRTLVAVHNGDRRRFARDGRLIGPAEPHLWMAWTWDVDRGVLLDRVRLADPPAESVWHDSLGFPTGRFLLLHNQNGFNRLSLRTGLPAGSPPRSTEPVVRMRWARGGRALVTDRHYHLTEWDTTSGRMLHHAPPTVSDEVWRGFSPGATSPDGRWQAAADERLVELFDARDGRPTHKLAGHERDVVALGFSIDGRLLASADEGGAVRVWNAAGGRQLRLLESSARTVKIQAVFFSPDGRRLATVEQSGRVRLWDVASGKLIRTLRPRRRQPGEEWLPGDWHRPVGLFLPRQDLFVLIHRAHLRAWDLQSGREVDHFAEAAERGFTLAERWLSLSADGRFLLRLDAELRLYEVASGQVIHHFPGGWTAAAFHPERLQFAAASARHLDVLIWDLKTVFRSLPEGGPGAPELATLWADLATDDASRAHRALWRLVARPLADGFLADRLRPVPRVDPTTQQRWIADLGSNRFATRKRAEEALAVAAEAVGPALREAHGKALDLETRLRLARLLTQLDKRASERLRELRAVLVLEARGTPEARRLLAALAAGLPDARLTGEAKAALGRLTSSGRRPPR